MRSAVALLVLLVLVAGCVSLPGMQAAVSYGSLTSETIDLVVKGEAFPKEVVSDRTMHLVFDFTNKADAKLSNVEHTVYDRCLFSLSEGEDSWKFDLPQNYTRQETAKYRLSTVDFERDCYMRFTTSYESTKRTTQTIAALDKTEYDSRDVAGTLGEIPLYYKSTENPLGMGLSFSPAQPFRQDDTVYMYLDYSDIGSGFLYTLDKGSVEITYPGNLELVDCDDYERAEGSVIVFRKCGGSSGYGGYQDADIAIDTDGDGLLEQYEFRNAAAIPEDLAALASRMGGKLLGFRTPEGFGIAIVGGFVYIQTGFADGKYEYAAFYNGGACDTSSASTDPSNEVAKEVNVLRLDRDLNFMNRQAKRSTCTFTAKPGQPVDIDTLTITADYKYKLDNSIIVKVKPR